MTLQELKSEFTIKLKDIYPKKEVLAFFFLLVDFKLKLSRVDLALAPNKIINPTDLNFFSSALTDLQHQKPIQYILGETEFFGLLFKVNQHVLIPRPETEELVEWALEVGSWKLEVGSEEKGKRKEKKDQSHFNILDIGTGSGCIAISLAKNSPHASVYALDISPDALAIAKQNALINKVQVHFIKHDILNLNVIQSGAKNLHSLKFDLIISNPPYVRHSEKQAMQNNVLENEPHLALFVEDTNPLLFYNSIADFAKNKLNKNGQLFLEINQYLGKETTTLLHNKGFSDIELKKDMFGNDRMIRANFSNESIKTS